VRARKRFGQHFLRDSTILENIIDCLQISENDHVLEIGPGRGALTRYLTQLRCASLSAVELDRDLVALLKQEKAFQNKLNLHSADVLQFDFTALAQQVGAKLRLVGNLPYNISTPLLFHILEHLAHIEDMHFMLQRELVARIVAQVGDAAYGRLSVMLAPWLQAEQLFEVPPNAFLPPPKVWSAVVRLQPRVQPLFAVSPHYATVVRNAFSQRRKTLRNALKTLLPQDTICACGIDPGARPEMITPQMFNQLANQL
jgi:16S rRNA (adenine1518-N6/adenine1519-N6)-dimethyltransferase